MMKHDHNLVYKSRIGVTFLIGIAQFVMAVLALFSRLSEPAGSEYIVFNVLTDDKYWSGMFTICAILVWGILTVGDIITSPVDNFPIVGGVLSIMLGIVAFFMSQIWNVILWDIKYNHHTLAEAGAQITWKG